MYEAEWRPQPNRDGFRQRLRPDPIIAELHKVRENLGRRLPCTMLRSKPSCDIGVMLGGPVRPAYATSQVSIACCKLPVYD